MSAKKHIKGGEPNYDRSGYDDSKGNDENETLARVWKKYNEKGPRMSVRELDNEFNSLMLSGTSQQKVERMKEKFSEQLSMVKQKAKSFASRLGERIGSSSYTDSQVFEYLQSQFQKQDVPSSLQSAIYREVESLLQDRFPARSEYFRVRPRRSTKIGKKFGYVTPDTVGRMTIGSDKEKEIAKTIVELDTMNKALHANIIDQTIKYQDCDITAIKGKYDQHSHNPYTHVNPVVAALYLPKINYLEENTLYASISGIVKSRLMNEPISTRPDYELFYNMVTDSREAACDQQSPLNDLHIRSRIQVALWHSVINLRNGKYYNETSEQLLQHLDMCRYYMYDAPDLARTGDEGDIVRRLFATFSMRPIKVKTLPVFSNPSMMNTFTPYANMDMFNGTLDTLPMVNVRLGLYANSGSTGAAATGTGAPAAPAVPQTPKIKDVLSSQELFFDGQSDVIVPKITKVMDANEILVVYVHRRQLSVPTPKNEPFSFRSLPLTTKDYFTLNNRPVDYGANVNPQPMNQFNSVLELEGADGAPAVQFTLRSVVLVKVANYTDPSTTPPSQKQILQGSEAVIFPIFNESSVLGLSRSEHLVYDPSGVHKEYPSDEFSEPIVFGKYSALGVSLKTQIERRGVLFVFTKNDTTTPTS
jgi:hypothetical protein